MTLKLENQKFGRLTVLRRIGSRSKQSYWFCKCDCGGHNKVTGGDLKSGHTSSCGCKLKENITNFKHGQTDTRFYRVWVRMLRRCRNPKSKDYKEYGAVGIFCSKRWYIFKNFYNDMHLSFEEFEKGGNKATIDRINNLLGYCRKNCRWATTKQQNRNKKNNINVFYRGEKMCLKDFAEKIGQPYHKIYDTHRHKNLRDHFDITYV